MSQPRDRWAWLFDFVTMVAVLIGLTFGAMELRHFRVAQESQVVLELFRIVQSPEYLRGSALIATLPVGVTQDELEAAFTEAELDAIGSTRLTFENLGVMVYRGDVSIEWVEEMYRFSVINTWQKFEASTLDIRARLSYPDAFEWHQWLAERLQERAMGAAAAPPAYEAYRDWRPSE